MNKTLSILTVLTSIGLLASSVSANASGFSFEWGDIPLCRTGKPNVVGNPVFTFSDVPDGTSWVYFKLKDKNAPGYNHGGGWAELNGKTSVEFGVFKYKSPCPPGGKHTYEWTAYFTPEKSKLDWNGKPKGTISKVTASKKYPE